MPQSCVFDVPFIDCAYFHREHPNKFKDGQAAIYGMAESIPDRSLVDEVGRIFIDAMYSV